MRMIPLIRQNDDPKAPPRALSVNDISIHLFPFRDIILESHVHPKFVILEVGRKMRLLKAKVVGKLTLVPLIIKFSLFIMLGPHRYLMMPTLTRFSITKQTPTEVTKEMGRVIAPHVAESRTRTHANDYGRMIQLPLHPP